MSLACSEDVHDMLEFYGPVPEPCNLLGEEVGKDEGKETHGMMKPEPVLWHEMSVKNTSPKYIVRQNIRSCKSHSNVSDQCFCTGSSCWVIYPRQAIPTPSCPHFLNTFQTSSYQNLTAATISPDYTGVLGWRNETGRGQAIAMAKWRPSTNPAIMKCCVLVIFQNMHKMGGSTLVLQPHAPVAILLGAVRTPTSVWRIHYVPQVPHLTLLPLTTPQPLKVREKYSVSP